ncbi:hypothetical protein AAMO2058_001723800 [Amorphochlora amoebiformis]
MEIHCDPVLHLKSQEDAMNRGTYEASSIRSRLSKAFADHDVEVPDISFPNIMSESLLSYKKYSGWIESEKWSANFKFKKEIFFKNGVQDTERCKELIGILEDLLLKSEIKFEEMWCEPGCILCRAIISSREITNILDKRPIILGMFRKLFESGKIKSVPTLSVAKINQSKNSGYLSARRLKVHAQASWTATLHMIETLLRPASLPSGLHVKKMDFFPVICPHASTEISSRFMDKLHLIAGLIRVFKQLFPDGPIWARIFGKALEFLGLDYHISSMDGDTTCTGFPSIRSTRGEINHLSPGANVSGLTIQRTPGHRSDESSEKSIWNQNGLSVSSVSLFPSLQKYNSSEVQQTSNRRTSFWSKKERKSSNKKGKEKKVNSHWCGSFRKAGLPHGIEICEDGLFQVACDVIRPILGIGECRVAEDTIKKAYIAIMKRMGFTSELITSMKEHMQFPTMQSSPSSHSEQGSRGDRKQSDAHPLHTQTGAQPPVVPIDVEDETQPPIPLAPTGDGPYPSINLSSERIPNPTSHARAIQVTPLPRYSQQRIFMKGSAYEMERVEHHSRRAPAYWKRVKNEGKQKFHDCALTLEVAQENYFKDDGKRQDVARCTRFIDCYTSFFERQNIKYNDPRGNEGCSMFMFGRFAWRIPRLAIPNDFKGLVLSGNIKCLPTVSIIRTHIPRGMTPLQLVDVDGLHDLGHTSIHIASLLECTANLESSENKCMTALLPACYEERLLNPINLQNMLRAVEAGDLKGLKSFMGRYQDHPEFYINQAHDLRGRTLLLEACNCEHIDIVRYLLGVKADTNISDFRDGETPLLAACQAGSLPILKLLLEHKANIETANILGQGPLHYAAGFGNLSTVKYLVEEAKIDIKAVNRYGVGPLHCAAASGDLSIVKYLVEEAKIDVKAVAESGAGPLHKAAGSGNLSTVKYLVEEAKIDIKAVDRYGMSINTQCDVWDSLWRTLVILDKSSKS